MYISILHLLWIVPTATAFGVFLTAIVVANAWEDDNQ